MIRGFYSSTDLLAVAVEIWVLRVFTLENRNFGDPSMPWQLRTSKRAQIQKRATDRSEDFLVALHGVLRGPPIQSR